MPQFGGLSRGTRVALASGMAPHISIAALLVVLAACGAPGNPVRSPSNAQQPPATTTSDGKVIGADGVPPGQKLEEGPRLDSRDGLKPAATPPRE